MSGYRYEVFVDHGEEKSAEDLLHPDYKGEHGWAEGAAEAAAWHIDAIDEATFLVHNLDTDAWVQVELEEIRTYRVKRADRVEPEDFMVAQELDRP